MTDVDESEGKEENLILMIVLFKLQSEFSL